MDKKPVFVFTIADDNNLEYAHMLEKSFKKFHPLVPFHIVTGDELAKHIKADQKFFYRATPIIAARYIKEYDLVLKIDADSIVTGSLDYVFNTKDYDIGTVMNWNRIDPQKYGFVQGWGISPMDYFNCGFVAMRSEVFVKHWETVCLEPRFNNFQYGEQDLLNILAYYGMYNVRCFDHGDGPAKYFAWHGLVSKGEWIKAKVVNNEIIVPKGEGNTPFPPKDVVLKVIHWAGGKDGKKMTYRTAFKEDVIKRLDELVK